MPNSLCNNDFVTKKIIVEKDIVNFWIQSMHRSLCEAVSTSGLTFDKFGNENGNGLKACIIFFFKHYFRPVYVEKLFILNDSSTDESFSWSLAPVTFLW